MTRVIAVANQKGGVGKTTTVMNLGAALNQLGNKVLLIDLDPQASLTASLSHDRRRELSIYEVVEGQAALADIIIPLRPGLDLIPADIDLAAAEVELISVLGREYVLKEALAPLKESYDYIIVDCAPSLGLLTINALTAADEVIIPVQTHYLAMRGLKTLIETINKVRTRLNPHLKIAGILGTMYTRGTLHAQEVMNELRAVFGELVFEITIPSSIRFAEAPVVHKPLIEYDAHHPGAQAYRQLAEVIAHGKKENES